MEWVTGLCSEPGGGSDAKRRGKRWHLEGLDSPVRDIWPR